MDRFELSPSDTEYPSQLLPLADRPSRLYGIGDPTALVPGLAVIGARRATPYGLRIASQLAGWAAEAGYTIISGGAVGCDQAAHRAALETGGKTIAVLGNGADVVYPRGAGDLLSSIAANGAVVSEYPWKAQPQRWHFPRRNRIIAGLAQVLLVVEASVPSGTFSTVDHALEMGRTVATVPGSVFSDGSRGPNRLIRQGAEVVTAPSDLALLLESELGPANYRSADSQFEDSATDDPMLNALRADPMRPDDIAFELGLDIVTVARRLAVLEGSDLVARYKDGRYGPC